MSQPGDHLPPSRRSEVVEAALFVGGPPLTVDDYAKAFPDAGSRELARTVEHLRTRYSAENRPYSIVEVDGGYVMQLLDRYRMNLAEKMAPTRPAKLSRSVIDVLSVIAYRQPITKVKIDELVGLDCSASLKQLVKRGIVTTVEIEPQNGEKPVLAYATAERFLSLFHLESLDDLPVSEELERS